MRLLRRIESLNINVLDKEGWNMRKKEKATEAAPHTNRGKDTKNICIRATVKALFRTGKKFTAKRINQLTRSPARNSLRRE